MASKAEEKGAKTNGRKRSTALIVLIDGDTISTKSGYTTVLRHMNPGEMVSVETSLGERVSFPFERIHRIAEVKD